MAEQVLGLFDGRLTERQLQSNRTNLLEGVTDACTRNLQMLALLKDKGSILFGQGGFGMFWKVMYKHHKVVGSNGERARSWGQTNQFRTARLDYRGYEATNTISRKELKQNRGESAVIKIFDDFEKNLIASMEQGLGPEFYGDGDNPANPDAWHGLLSLIRQNGKTIEAATNTKRSRNDADRVIYAEGSYAGLDCELASYGGSQAQTNVSWPEGTANSEYDFWTPLMLQWDGTGFGVGTNATNGNKLVDALQYGLIHSQRNTNLNGAISNFWTDRSSFFALKQHATSLQTIEVTTGGDLYRLGFKNTIEIDGVTCSFENAIPTGYGFGVNIEDVELRCLDDQLFEIDGPDWDVDLQIWKTAVQTNSNLVYRSPRNFLALVPKASVVAA